VTWLDVAVTVTICLLAAFGFWKGIVRAVIGIAGLLGGLLVAGSLHRQVAAMLWPSGGTWSLIAAYAIILIATLVVAALLAALVSRLIHTTALGMVDRIVGLAAGAIVATMGWALLLALFVPLIPGFADLVSQSPVARLLLYWSLAVNGLATDPGYTV
jgi:membrane protein required for colicin V production